MNEKIINVPLSERQVQVLLGLLGSAPMPYKESAPIIQTLSQALMASQSDTEAGSVHSDIVRDADTKPEVVEEGGAGFPLQDGKREHTN